MIAPYNVQVNKLAKQLTGRARVGTVDQFQGQEAPVCIYSFTSSMVEYNSNASEMLLSKKRLNVALSRSKCLSIIVKSNTLVHTSSKGNINDIMASNTLISLEQRCR